MASATALLGPDGREIPSRAIARARDLARMGAGRPRQRGSLEGSAPDWFPYDAANWSTKDYSDWLPWIRSPDAEIDFYRDRIAARARDLYRNDGWARGSIGRILDSTIGSSYRLVAKPDWMALRADHGPGFDHVWAQEFKESIEARWRVWSTDIGRYNDVAREMTVSQQFRLCLAHKLVDGESLMLAYWLPDRIGQNGNRYATCFLGVDPDRLSNPFQEIDTRHRRNGVELDDNGVPVAYWLRKAHQNDWYNAAQSMQWERIPREDEDGWRRVYHDFDRDRFTQHRGMTIFAPILGRLKMLARYYGVELSAATVASAFGLYVQSPFDADMIRTALENEDDDERGIGWYQEMRRDFHRERNLSVNDVKIAMLAPGESINSVNPTRPNSEFSPFTHEMLRGVASVLGMSAEQVHNDYSEASWSSARAGIVEAEKTFVRRLRDFDENTAGPMYATWLGEVFDKGDVPLPRGAPAYLEARTAYAKCMWLGAARGWVDPVAERQGAVLGLDAGFSTLEIEVAKQGGDWREFVHQRAAERQLFNELGLPHPTWQGEDKTNLGTPTATEQSKKPKAT